MQNTSFNTFFLNDRIDRLYFSGVDVAEGYLVIGKIKAYFADARYFAEMQTALKNTDINPILFKDMQSIGDYLKTENVTEVYANYEKLSVKEYNELLGLGLKVVSGENRIKELRQVKTEAELDKIKKACEIAQKAYYTGIKCVKAGITELELKDIIERLMLDFGAEDIGFETIVAFGKNSAVPHHVTDNTRLKNDECVLIDMGAKYKGYISDLTRTAFFGTPSAKFIEVYNSVLNANLIAEEKITSGVTASVADGFARSYLAEQGYGEYFTHSLGHGVGLEVHEFPTLSPKYSDKLVEGAVFTVEPGVYLDNEFGVRIEDTVCLKNGKLTRLFTDEKKLLLI